MPTISLGSQILKNTAGSAIATQVGVAARFSPIGIISLPTLGAVAAGSVVTSLVEYGVAKYREKPSTGTGPALVNPNDTSAQTWGKIFGLGVYSIAKCAANAAIGSALLGLMGVAGLPAATSLAATAAIGGVATVVVMTIWNVAFAAKAKVDPVTPEQSDKPAVPAPEGDAAAAV